MARTVEGSAPWSKKGQRDRAWERERLGSFPFQVSTVCPRLRSCAHDPWSILLNRTPHHAGLEQNGFRRSSSISSISSLSCRSRLPRSFILSTPAQRSLRPRSSTVRQQPETRIGSSAQIIGIIDLARRSSAAVQ